MADNPIPEELKSNHLFLLVGGNPLPNWVAARLLLREGGQVYLVHSKETNDVARRLAGVLFKQQYRPPVYVPVIDASSPHEVYRALEQQVETIKSGQIGFNYTGGTKVMSVHGYFAIKQRHVQGLPAPIFSYLDALSLKLYFDDGREPIFVGLAPRASLTLKELLSFHEVVGMQNPKREPVAPSVVEALKELHGNEDRYLKWRKWIMELQKPCPTMITCERSLASRTLSRSLHARAKQSPAGWWRMNSRNSSRSEKRFTSMILPSRRSIAEKVLRRISYRSSSRLPENAALTSFLCRPIKEIFLRYACTNPWANVRTSIILIFRFSGRKDN